MKTVTPYSLETLAKIAEAMDISLADFSPEQKRRTTAIRRKCWAELSEDEIRFLSEIKRYSTSLSDGDKRLVLAHDSEDGKPDSSSPRKPAVRRTAF